MSFEDDLRAMVDKVHRGDAAAKEEFFRHCMERARRFALERLGVKLKTKVDVEDIVDSSLRRLMQQLDGFEFRGLAAWEGWLRRIVENTINDTGRALNGPTRAPPGGLISLSESPTDSGMMATEPASPGPGPTTVVRQQESFEVLRRELASLPEVQRQVILLHHLEGKSISEVARRLGRSESAIESLLVRARQKLKKANNAIE